MPIRTNGAASNFQSVTGNLQYFMVFVSSPLAFTDPENATGVNILITNDFSDESQKNFEVLLQSVGLRSMPVLMNDPVPVADLSLANAPTLTGEGFVWKFSVERTEVFNNSGPSGTLGPIGFLVDELNGIVLPNATVLSTAGAGVNIEFSLAALL